MRKKFTPELRRKRRVDMWMLRFISRMEQHLFQCFTQMPSSLPHWIQADLPSYGPRPAHSPHLSPLDYFLWGCLKDRVSANNPQTIDALNINIWTEIRRIPHDLLDRVIANVNAGVPTVIQRQGSWLEHIELCSQNGGVREKMLHHTKLWRLCKTCLWKKLQSIPFNTKCYFIKIGYIVLDHPEKII